MNCAAGIDVGTWMECTPPVFAILLEFFPLLNKHAIDRHANAALHGIVAQTPNIHLRLTSFADGILATNGLVATALAFIATALTFHNTAWSFLSMVLVMVVGLMVHSLLSARAPHELVGPVRTRKHIYPHVKYTHLISLAIVFVNLVLIGLVLYHGLDSGESCSTSAANEPTKNASASIVGYILLSQLILAVLLAILLIFGNGVIAKVLSGLLALLLFASVIWLLVHARPVDVDAKVDDGKTESINKLVAGQQQIVDLLRQILSRIDESGSATTGTFSLRHVSRVGPFLPSQAKLSDEMTSEISRDVCSAESRMAGHGDGSIFVLVGDADRRPLSEPELGRYGSNTGLAQARAEAVKGYLTQACSRAFTGAQFLTLIGGPRLTPQHRNVGSDELAGDRIVDIWLLTSSAKTKSP